MIDSVCYYEISSGGSSTLKIKLTEKGHDNKETNRIELQGLFVETSVPFLPVFIVK